MTLPVSFSNEACLGEELRFKRGRAWSGTVEPVRSHLVETLSFF
jgi:hypothetical protein